MEQVKQERWARQTRDIQVPTAPLGQKHSSLGVSITAAQLTQDLH